MTRRDVAGAIKEHMPQWLRLGLRRLRRWIGGRPESTFMRVAYSTPRQVVLITARHAGAENVWPIDWHLPLSLQPELYSIAVNPRGYGAELVRRSGVFVVNFVPATWEELIFFCGNVSGRDVDKFAKAGLRREEAESVDAPRIADALGVLECKVLQTLELGDHALFIGEVTHKLHRADAPRLHHLDLRLSEVSVDFEGPSVGDGLALDRARGTSQRQSD
jgi:flavin reductase (DIM6/NTAB) family NADH-FMN oxidoreductase RutF